MRFSRCLWMIFALVLFLVGCQGAPDSNLPTPKPLPKAADSEPTPLVITLSEGEKGEQARAAGLKSQGAPLPPKRVAKLQEMFSAPLAKEKNKPAFLQREDSKPAPKAAETKELPFPTKQGSKAPDVNTQEFSVSSIAPKGNIPRAPRLSITFTTPMISVSDPTEDEKGDPLGIVISPRPEGQWRWLGTQTLIFEPEGGEFPRATEYTVTVPAGISDVSGQKLEREVRRSFSLPGPKVESANEQVSDMGLDPVFYVVYDQAVRAGSVAKHVSLRTGGKSVGLRTLSPSEAERSRPGITEQFGERFQDRVFYFQPTRQLENGTSYVLVVGKGVQGLEGPLVSDRDSTHLFSTYQALKVKSVSPWGFGKATPTESLSVLFNNELDPKSFSQDLVTASPKIDDMKVQLQGHEILIEGTKLGKSTYKITLSKKFTDRYGQKLGKDTDHFFRTKSEPKQLQHGFNSLTILDPSSPGVLPIYTTNIKEVRLRVQRVEPKDWSDYLKFRDVLRYTHKWEKGKELKPPGETLEEKLVLIGGKADSMKETFLDLSNYLNEGEGNIVVWVIDPIEEKDSNRKREFLTWVQGTKLGIDMVADHNKIRVLVTSLLDGSPVENAEVNLGKAKERTDAEGLATLKLPSFPAKACYVQSAQDSAFLPKKHSYEEGWSKSSLVPEQEWFVFNDRGLYRPGETAHVKGYLRTWTRGPKAKLVQSAETGTNISWVLRDGRDNRIGKGTTKLNRFGAFDLEIKIPKDTNLGSHRLTLSGVGNPERHYLKVEEFRRPEFEVETKALSSNPNLLLGDATVEASASYYSGGDLGGSEVNWSVESAGTSYTPPGRNDYSFGPWHPWWYDRSYLSLVGLGQGPVLEHKGKTDIDGSHRLKLSFDKMSPPQPTSVRATATIANVNRQQMSSSTTLLVHPSERYVGLQAEKSFVDDESDFEVKSLVTDIDGKILVGIPITVELLKLESALNAQGEYEPKNVVVQSESFLSKEVANKLTLTPKTGGSYKVRASVLDQAGRLNETELNLWKAGGATPSQDKVKLEKLTLIPDRKNYEPGQKARLLVMAPFTEGEGLATWSRDGVLDSQRFTLKNGTATIEKHLDASLTPNVHLHTVIVGKTKYGKGFRPAVASANLNLPISKASKTLSIDLLPAQEKLEPGSEVDLEVVVKDHQGKPVRDSEVTLWVVDEAVLGLADYKTPDALEYFITDRNSQLSFTHSRPLVALAEVEAAELPEVVNGNGVDDPDRIPILGTMFRRDNDGLRNGSGFTSRGIVGESLRVGGGNATFNNYDSLVGARAGAAFNSSKGFDAEWAHSRYLPENREIDQRVATLDRITAYGEVDPRAIISDQIDAGSEFSAYTSGESSEPKSFIVRYNFDALAMFRGDLVTDTSGKTKVKVKLPDNLTRYRIMSVAVKDDDLFGKGDHVITSRLPLMVRPSLPRFLNFGDKATLPVVLQNQTDKDMTIDVIGQATGVEWIGPKARRVKVPANERVEVQFEAEATAVGQAHFRFGAVSGKHSDAATLSLPVYTPASGEGFATYGSVTEGAVEQPVQRPTDTWPQFGGLKVSLSSTALSELTDAFLYLYEYPHECAEQKSSRILAVAAMREVLSALNPDLMPSAASVKAQMKRDLLHLDRLQNSDGGFEYWRRNGDSQPFVTVHVAHALARAKTEGYEVDAGTLKQALTYLSNIESKCQAEKYGQHTTRSLTAYALYVRHLAKDADVTKATELYTELAAEKNPNLEAIAWLWPTLSEHAKDSQELADLRTLIKNRASQTAEKAQFTTSYQQNEGRHLLLQSSQRTDAILLAGLVNDQASNPLNTKLVRGLLSNRIKGRWNNTQENIWVLLALQSYFRAYESETPNFLAQAWLKETYLGEESFQGHSNKEAQIRIPMTELPEDKAALTISKKGPGRLYYRIGMKYAPKSLRLPAESRGFMVERSFRGLDKTDDVSQAENGDWSIKAGAKVEVTLTMVAPERRYHVALIDYLPAGLEALNPSFKGTPPTSNEQTWWGRWYDHENLRDERVEAFASMISPGVYTYRYTALATTPGDYVLPPLKAEEMYSPEVFGRTATGRLTVK